MRSSASRRARLEGPTVRVLVMLRDARWACSSCFETHATRAPQHDSSQHSHPEERCEAARLEGPVSKGPRCACSSCFETHVARAPHASRRTLRVLLSMTVVSIVTLRSDAKQRVSKGPSRRAHGARARHASRRTLRVLLMLRDARCACSSA